MYHLHKQEYRELIIALLCEEFGSIVGGQLSFSNNIKTMEKILLTIARKKTERSFVERLEIRKELELLVGQLKRDEVICGVNTYEWILEVLIYYGVIKIEKKKNKKKRHYFTAINLFYI